MEREPYPTPRDLCLMAIAGYFRCYGVSAWANFGMRRKGIAEACASSRAHGLTGAR
jgi:hypothetical protein